jgi:hypothetical protein
MVCPYSGHVAPDEEFVHPDDIEAVKRRVVSDVAADIEDFLGEMARDFNRRQPRGGFISMRMDYKPSHRPSPVVIRQDLLRDLQCDVCQRAYAVYAIALFCPDCGAPNLALHFKREVALITEQVALANTQASAGKSEFAYRLMGNAHEDVLTAFEAALKAVYRHLIRLRLPEQAKDLCSTKSISNAFQNIERAKEKFSILAIDPFAGLSPEDMSVLRVNIEKRHVIGHNLGIADERYAELTQAEQPGKTVKIIGEEVNRFGKLCLDTITRLEVHLLPAA